MPSRFTLQAKAGVANNEVEPPPMRTAIYGVVALGAPALLEAEKHGTNECHQGTFAGLVRPVKYVESWMERSPVLIRPDSESIDVNVLDSHNVLGIPLLAEEGAKHKPDRAKPQKRMR